MRSSELLKLRKGTQTRGAQPAESVAFFQALLGAGLRGAFAGYYSPRGQRFLFRRGKSFWVLSMRHF